MGLLGAVVKLATLPLTWAKRYVSLLLAWVIRLVGVVGIQPMGFIPAEKLSELNSIVRRLHTREDLYRKAIREMQEDLDAKDSDRKKALKKLKSTKEEIALLSENLAAVRGEYEKGNANEHMDADGRQRAVDGMGQGLIHASLLLLLGMLWLSSKQESGALQWKIVLSIIFPVRLFLFLGPCVHKHVSETMLLDELQILWMYVSNLSGLSSNGFTCVSFIFHCLLLYRLFCWLATCCTDLLACWLAVVFKSDVVMVLQRIMYFMLMLGPHWIYWCPRCIKLWCITTVV